MGEFKIWFEILVIYIIGAALLVILHIQKTQKWAAQYNAPLRSGKHTMISGIINCKNLDAINIAMLMRTYEYVMFIYEMTEFVASGYVPTHEIWINTRV